MKCGHAVMTLCSNGVVSHRANEAEMEETASMQMVTPAVEADNEPREMNAEDQLPHGDDSAAEPIGPSDEATKLAEDSSDVVTTAESEPATDQNQEETASDQERLVPAEDAEQEVEGKAVKNSHSSS